MYTILAYNSTYIVHIYLVTYVATYLNAFKKTRNSSSNQTSVLSKQHHSIQTRIQFNERIKLIADKLINKQTGYYKR